MLAHPPPICTTWSHYRPPTCIKWLAELISLSYLVRGSLTLLTPVTRWALTCCTQNTCVAIALAPVVYCRVLWLSSTQVFQRFSLTCPVDSLSCEVCMDAFAKISRPIIYTDRQDSCRDVGTTRYSTPDPVDISTSHLLV